MTAGKAPFALPHRTARAKSTRVNAWQHEIELAKSLAVESGTLAMKYLRAGNAALGTTWKPKNAGPVTLADRAINDYLVSALSQAFPHDGVVSEEGDNDRGATQRRRVWYVDPIDGTREFAKGQPSWAIHIGMSEHGVARLGVVFEAAEQRMSWGVVGQGAWLRERDQREVPLHTSSRTLGRLRLVSSKSHPSPRIFEVMNALSIAPHDNLKIGSVGVKLMHIARGELDLYVHPTGGTNLWDTCAPEAVVTAAGGILTDLMGRPLAYGHGELANRFGVLATNGTCHEQVLERVAPLAAKWFGRALGHG